MTPVNTQTASNQPDEPTSREISAETMKMPEPIMEPATSMVESNRPRRCWKCGGPDAGASAPPHFQQRLGLFDSTMLVAGSMIGSGIFIVSAEISRDVGSSGWLLAVWVLTGVMTVIGALSYA